MLYPCRPRAGGFALDLLWLGLGTRCRAQAFPAAAVRPLLGLGADTRQHREDDQQHTRRAPNDFGNVVGCEDAERAVTVGERDQGGHGERKPDDQRKALGGPVPRSGEQ